MKEFIFVNIHMNIVVQDEIHAIQLKSIKPHCTHWYFSFSLSQNQLVNLQSSLQVMGESDNNTAAVQGADGKVRCVNTEPEVPKCEVSSIIFTYYDILLLQNS